MKILVASLLAGTLALGLGAWADASAHAQKAAPHAHDHGHAKHATEPAVFVKGTLVDHHGMTLYTFDPDVAESGKSVCNDGCIAAWPALVAPKDAKKTGDFSVITRDDGSHQWAWKGKPLYLWVQDKKAGDVTGDNFNKVWHIVKQH